MIKRLLFACAFTMLSATLVAQPLQPKGVYPTHWWVGMKNPNLQLMVHAPGAATYRYTITDPRVQVVKVTPAENPNYAFIDLRLRPNARPGALKVNWAKGSERGSFDYELRARRAGNGTAFAQGVRAQDFIYLLMPDRFANGDTRNDRIGRYRDQSLTRDSMYHRHGGDIQGVIDRLGYLQDLGVTAVWMTPVLENDMPNRTEHGYAITNHYQVDERHGGNLAYRRLSDSLHRRGMKLIQDAVYNHVGIQHFFVQDPPMKDWLHQWPSYQQTNYKDQTLMDPYGAPKEQRIMEKGWFTREMPDLNQHNPFVANFLIQHAIWSVEEFGVDGWRIDTYIYNDLEFMNRCNQALYNEYPKITLFGETWVHGVLNQAYFMRNNLTNIPVKSNLQGVTDFQTNMYGITPALTENFGWTEGVNKLYSTLANDYVYQDPMLNVNFLDNHDKSRFLSTVNEDVDKLKVGIGWLLTARGIPQLYYGTEILLKGVSNPDGLVRGDFTGGWKEDKQNKFTDAGRTGREKEVYEWTRSIAQYRKRSTALQTGKFMQYLPQDWVYTYFRYDDKSTVMIVMNTSADERTVDPQYFSERTAGFRMAKPVTGGESKTLSDKWKIPGKSIWILELSK